MSDKTQDLLMELDYKRFNISKFVTFSLFFNVISFLVLFGGSSCGSLCFAIIGGVGMIISIIFFKIFSSISKKIENEIIKYNSDINGKYTSDGYDY